MEVHLHNPTVCYSSNSRLHSWYCEQGGFHCFAHQSQNRELKHCKVLFHSITYFTFFGASVKLLNTLVHYSNH